MTRHDEQRRRDVYSVQGSAEIKYTKNVLVAGVVASRLLTKPKSSPIAPKNVDRSTLARIYSI